MMKLLKNTDGDQLNLRHWLLFIAGNELNSRTALKNVETFQKDLGDSCRLEIIDVIRNYEAAMMHDILVTPTLIQVFPQPRVVVLGNLSDRDKVLSALGIMENIR